MTLQNLGASLSPAIGGWVAQSLDYPATFLTPGAFSLVLLVLWVGRHAQLRPSCCG